MRFQYNKVEISGVDTANLPVITEEEKLDLLRKAQAGDELAREKMITSNLRLVLSVIQRFANRGEDMDDLFQVGCIGLIKAIDNFDLSLNVRFATYGVALITGELRRHIRDAAGCSLHVPRSTKDLAYHALRVREELLEGQTHEPTVNEIAARLDVPIRDVSSALEAILQPFSLFDPVYSDGGEAIYVMDQIGDPTSESDWIDEIVFREAVDALPPREKKILALRFLGGRTQMEVAQEIGISQAQVSRLEKGALGRIKSRM
jgi:RNA polymerase sporulation-specific sigma factor